MLGNPGHRPLPELPTATNDRVAIPKARRAPTPARKLDRSAMLLWRRLWTYASAWLSEGTDVEILTRYVENIQLRANLVERIPASMTTVGSHGTLMLHPLMRQLNQTERLLLQLETHLGFTPADRSRIGKAEITAHGKLEDLNDRREKRALEREQQRLAIDAERARIATMGSDGSSGPASS